MRLITKVLLAVIVFCSAPAVATDTGVRWVSVAGGSWSPQAETVSRIKRELEHYVKARAKLENKILRDWNTYIFQYQGQEENGKQFVFINAFCTATNILESMENRLNKELVLVKDGGACSFSLKYDKEKHSFYELWFNGEA